MPRLSAMTAAVVASGRFITFAWISRSTGTEAQRRHPSRAVKAVPWAVFWDWSKLSRLRSRSIRPSKLRTPT